MVLSVKAWNYRLHEDLYFKLDGQSIILLGDTETGKTTFIRIILESLGLIPFDENPLKSGAESGGVEVTHDFGDGEIYTIKRRFTKKGLLRFEAIDKNGGSQAPTKVLNRIFGLAFANSYFDYKKYFYECSTSNQRTEYFIKCIGGAPILVNRRSINSNIKVRNSVGTDRTRYKTLVENSILKIETFAEDAVKYEQPKKLQDAYDDLGYQLLVAEYKEASNCLQDYDEIKKLNADFDAKETRNVEIDLEILALQEKIKALKVEKKDNEKWLKDNPADKDYEEELLMDVREFVASEEEWKTKITDALTAAENAINEFNQNRLLFNQASDYLEKFQEADEKWNDLSETIVELEEENERLFAEKLKIPGISIDEEERVVYEDEHGVKRELCFPNVSKGRAIRLSSEIQQFLNPKGNNFIVVPEGESLGSGLNEVMEECKKFNVQYIIEVTKSHQPFKIMFEEEYLNPKLPVVEKIEKISKKRAKN